MKKAHNRLNLVGQKFGRLQVIESAGSQVYGSQGKRKSVWLCLCDCGTSKIIAGGALTSGNSKSCGCAQRESIPISAARRKGKRLGSPGEANLAIIVRNTNNGAVSRGYDMKLTIDDIKNLAKGNCKYCGKSPIEIYDDDHLIDIYYNGIDRVNNDLGYTLSNCVTCCKICNQIKLNHAYEDFINQIKCIYEFRCKEQK
jgi:5-methylcytosine-specific restriction endonuclease McrA